MEKEDKHSLFQPLLPSFSPSTSSTTTISSCSTTTISTCSTTTISSNSLHNIDQQHYDHDADNNIIHRILLVLLVAIISIWANYEASKTFDIIIVNDTKDSPAGRRFDLSYVSNDKATRILLNTSSFVEHLLYPNKHYPKKRIESVTLRLTRRNPNTTTIATVTGKSFNLYVIDISPMLLEHENYDQMALVGAIQRGMARVWLWDGGSRAPLGILDGMAEYVAELAGFRRDMVTGGGGELPECDGWWWEDKDTRHVARMLHYCEKDNKGFIQRLNKAMRDTWHDRVVDEVLGMPALKICGLYNASWHSQI